jgi:hypothetical protein
MANSIYDHVKEMEIKAGAIKRHPVTQRWPSPLATWKRKNKKFDIKKVVESVHVVADGKGGYLAIDGATRAEACQEDKDFGNNVKLPCKVYGNGMPPTTEQLNELFLLLNADKVAVRSSVQLERAVGAGRESAVFADQQCKRLGPKFDAKTGIWNAVNLYGQQAVKAAVDEALAIWGTEHTIPGSVMTALVSIVIDRQKAKMLAARRKRLSRQSPRTWQVEAQNAMYRQVGKRNGLRDYLVKLLLGKHNL